MAAETSDEIIEELTAAISDYYLSERASGTMEIPEPPKVKTTCGRQISDIWYSKEHKKILISLD